MIRAKASLSQLEHATNLTRKSVIAGIQELAQRGCLQCHKRLFQNASQAYSVPIKLGGVISILPDVVDVAEKEGFESVSCGGSVISIPPTCNDDDVCNTDNDIDTDHTSYIMQVVEKLHHLGFTDAERFVEESEPELINQAIEHVSHLRDIREPGAMVRALVKAGHIPKRQKKPEAINKYKQGKYGHVVRS